MIKSIKTIHIIFICVFSSIFVACTNESRIESPSEEAGSKKITIEEHGVFHNEAILSVIENSTSSRSQETLGSVLHIMKERMTKKYPGKFKNLTINELKDILDFDQRLSDFKYDADFYEKLKAKVGKEKIEKEILVLLDKAFYEGHISEEDFPNTSLQNERLHTQFEIFKSYYYASEELWTKKVGEVYNIDQSHKGCDPTSQVILADAIGGTLIGIFTGGVGAPAGGGAVSLAVRTAQLEEYGGGCIE